MLKDTNAFYHCIPLSVALISAGVIRSVESKTCWPHFLENFSTEWDEIFVVSGNKCWFTHCIIIFFNFGKHSDVYELFCFKLPLVVGTTELYILILAFVTLTLTEGNRDVRKQNHLQQLSHKVWNGFGWNLISCCDLLVWWSSKSIHLANPYSREAIQLSLFHWGGGGLVVGGGCNSPKWTPPPPPQKKKLAHIFTFTNWFLINVIW